MQKGFRCSELELRRPKNDLEMGPRSSRGVSSAVLCALNPMVATKRRLGRPNGAEKTNLSDPNS
eukprot:6865962-Alexandrium_andersonii.AAC.1